MIDANDCTASILIQLRRRALPTVRQKQTADELRVGIPAPKASND